MSPGASAAPSEPFPSRRGPPGERRRPAVSHELDELLGGQLRGPRAPGRRGGRETTLHRAVEGVVWDDRAAGDLPPRALRDHRLPLGGRPALRLAGPLRDRRRGTCSRTRSSRRCSPQIPRTPCSRSGASTPTATDPCTRPSATRSPRPLDRVPPPRARPGAQVPDHRHARRRPGPIGRSRRSSPAPCASAASSTARPTSGRSSTTTRPQRS